MEGVCTLIKLLDTSISAEKFFISKKYPSTLDIRLQKTKFMALINKDNKYFYIGSNKKLIEAHEQSKDLPFIYGELDIDGFLKVIASIL